MCAVNVWRWKSDDSPCNSPRCSPAPPLVSVSSVFSLCFLQLNLLVWEMDSSHFWCTRQVICIFRCGSHFTGFHATGLTNQQQEVKRTTKLVYSESMKFVGVEEQLNFQQVLLQQVSSLKVARGFVIEVSGLWWARWWPFIHFKGYLKLKGENSFLKYPDSKVGVCPSSPTSNLSYSPAAPWVRTQTRDQSGNLLRLLFPSC